MPLSSRLAPGFIRLVYSGTRLPHHQVIPINFAGTPTPGVSPEILTSDATAIDWAVAALNYVDNVLAEQFDSTTNFGAGDIYSVDPVTGVRTFIYTATFPEVGTNVAANVPFSEGVWVFKSSVGKPIKVYTMESVYAAGSRNVGTVPADGRQIMVDYILSGENIFYGRQDAYPLAFQTFTSKINDVLRRNGGFADV